LINDSLSQAESQALKYMSEQCYDVYGSTVYHAYHWIPVDIRADYFYDKHIVFESCNQPRNLIVNKASQDKMTSISLTPNPANTFMNIHLPQNQHITHWEIVNLLGITMQNGAEALDQIQINVSGLPNGIYVIKGLFQDNSPFSHQFIITH
jgi:Secretion system C-terminal sorting domain